MHRDQVGESPRFSVLMASYNNAPYIAVAVESVINQTFKEWELVIVDDCSTDDSVEVVEAYLSDPRIRFFRNSSNLGYIGTLRRLIEESRADILGILDSDDALTSNALQRMYEAHIENPHCGFVYSNFVYCDEDLRPVEKGFCTALPRIPEQKTILRHDIVGPFRTFRKDAYLRTPGYDDDILYAEDKDLTLKMEEVTELLYVDEPLYLYRVLRNSQSHDPAKKGTMKSSFCLAKYKAFKRRLGTDIPNLTDKEMSDQLFLAVPHCIKARNWKRTGFFLLEAVRLSPLNIRGWSTLVLRGLKSLPRMLGQRGRNAKFHEYGKH
ncbi:MAG TPA: glycosyltransferase family 2 protein [Nitrospirae bacterium]|nr:glycosyltransferase family 2 protein [Nitrospirota bacterium]